jgi:putative sterol carrier protein
MVLSLNPVDELKKRFNPKAAKGISATYLIQILGPNGGKWLTKINDGKLELTEHDGSKNAQYDCSISISAEDLELIMTGKLSAVTAAMSGMLSIDGELGLAMQLLPIFFPGQSPSIG